MPFSESDMTFKTVAMTDTSFFLEKMFFQNIKCSRCSPGYICRHVALTQLSGILEIKKSFSLLVTLSHKLTKQHTV